MFKNFLSKFLARVNPNKPYGAELFNALARLTLTVACEAVYTRKNPQGETEVYLTVREENEVYAGALHCPGSVMRPGENFNDVFNRLGIKEFGASISSFKLKGVIMNTKEKRGHFVQLVFSVELEGEPSGGAWYNLKNLPALVPDFQREFTLPIGAGEKVENTENYSISLVNI